MTRTAIACPEPPPRRNEPVAWTSGTTTTTWIRIDVKQ